MSHFPSLVISGALTLLSLTLLIILADWIWTKTRGVITTWRWRKHG